jgi:hypothetical protein
VAIIDTRMAPNNSDDGLQAALTIRNELPEVGILLLSQYVEDRDLTQLLAGGAHGVGYLLKDGGRGGTSGAMGFLAHGTAAEYRAALPGREELNPLRGALPGGAYGVVRQGEARDRLHRRQLRLKRHLYRGPRDSQGRFRRLLGWVPVVGMFVGSAPTAKVRVPCTVAAVRVPETAGTLTHPRLDRRRSSPPFSFGKRTKLRELGPQGLGLYAGPSSSPMWWSGYWPSR